MTNVGSSGTPGGTGSGHPPRRAFDMIPKIAGWLIALIIFIAIVWIGTIMVSERFGRQATGVSSTNSPDADRAAASLMMLVTEAVKATVVAQEAVDKQAKAEMDSLEKARKADKAESDALAARVDADKANNEKSANSKTREETALKSKTDADKAKEDRLDAERNATQKAGETIKAVAASELALVKAQSLAETKSTFHWYPFFLLALLFLSVFPLSAFAFRHREVPLILAQLKADYKMLGGLQTTGMGDGQMDPTDPRERWNWLGYALHCCLTIFVAIVGAALFCWRSSLLLDPNTQRGMQLGFLGAYVYCLQMVYRRYTTRDLQPHIYFSCAVGLIAGMVFNYVAFTAITNIASSTAEPEAAEFKGVGAGAAAILAFSLGYFPNLAIRWFGRISRTSVHERQRRSDALPLSLIDGISELHESRLQDEGIDNVQNLAAADIHDLVEKTPYSAQQIVEWVDQAVLYLYVDPGEIDSFRRAGVRSVTDFCDIWGGFNIRFLPQSDGTVKRLPPSTIEVEFNTRRRSIAQQLATTEERLDCLFLATEQGPNMDHIRTYWVNMQNAATQTRNLLVNQVCGRVGRVLRESMRDGTSLDAASLLVPVARGLFSGTGQNETVAVTAESLYGQAYLKVRLHEFSAARRLYLDCINQFPEDPVAYNDLAWLDLTNSFQSCDLWAARGFAAQAVLCTTNLKAAAEKSAAQAAALKVKEETAANRAVPDGDANANAKAEALRHLADAGKAEIEHAVKVAEVEKLAKDLAGYRDTLALAEIRLKKPEQGEKLVNEAIADWAKLKNGNDARFLDTLVCAAEAYVLQHELQKAANVLKQVEDLNYAKRDTIKKAKELQEKYNLPPAEQIQPAPGHKDAPPVIGAERVDLTTGTGEAASATETPKVEPAAGVKEGEPPVVSEKGQDTN